MGEGERMNIYIISSGETCKIGVAKDVDSRVVSLRTGSAAPLTVQHSMRCKSSRVAYKIERLCHRVLSDKRLEGEWFACSPMEAALALNEAVLEFAAQDDGYIDMPRGGEMALSSKAMRYVKSMCVKTGLKVADIVDEAIVEHFGPIIDRHNRMEKPIVVKAKSPKTRGKPGRPKRSEDETRRRIEALIRNSGQQGIARGRLRDRLHIDDLHLMEDTLDELISANKARETKEIVGPGRPKERLIWVGQTAVH